MIVVMSIIAAITIIVVIMQVITQTDQTQLTQTDQTQLTQTDQTRSEYETREITISDIRITVEIADDNEKITKGLMFREGLPDKHGMLFVFEEERKYQFWMMNMKFNIDIIWLDEDGKVVYVVEGAEPCIDEAHISLCAYKPDETAKYVLEVNSGFVKKYGISENSRMISS